MEPHQQITMIAAVERLVRVEVRLESLVEHMKHMDFCVDDLKRTVWKASGALAIVMLIAGWFLKHT